MLTTFQQQYAKPTRTVIGGIPATLFTDDVVLLCQTNLLPVTINLLGIASNWSPEYKIYVIDNSNNASVNNITINAPVGYTINGASSVVVNTNGGSLVIRAVSNTKYISQSSSGGVAGYTTIQDEGVGLPQRSIINFTGGGVTASDVGGKTQVNVIGGIIPITNANMLILISSNLVVPSQLYLITDAQYTDGGVVVVGLTSKSISLDGKGYFLNADYQAIGNYTGVTGFVANIGIWYSGFAGVVNIGDVVIWNNIHYKNLTGVWGTDPDTDAVNWQPLPKQNNTGYIFDIGFIKYDLANNFITYRADSTGNECDYSVDLSGVSSFAKFPWGRDKYNGNKILSGSSAFVCNSFYAFFQGNVLENGSKIIAINSNFIANSSPLSYNFIANESVMNLTNCYASITQNFLNSLSIITINTSDELSFILRNNLTTRSTFGLNNLISSSFSTNRLSSNSSLVITSSCTGTTFMDNEQNSDSDFGFSVLISSAVTGNNLNSNGFVQVNNTANTLTLNRNSFSSYGRIIIADINAGSFSNCTIENEGVIQIPIGTFSSVFTGCYLSKSKSTFTGTLDFTTAYAGGNLTLTSDFIGIWTVTNSTALTPVNKIVGYGSGVPNFDITFIPDPTSNMPFTTTSIPFTTPDDICGNTIGTITAKGRVNGVDSITIRRGGNLWSITETIINN